MPLHHPSEDTKITNMEKPNLNETNIKDFRDINDINAEQIIVRTNI